MANVVEVPEAVVARAARVLKMQAMKIQALGGGDKKATQEWRDAECLFRLLREAKQARSRPTAQGVGFTY